MIVKMYADLVEQKLRALTEADAAVWECVMVPVIYRARVEAEMVSRQAA
jgi:hypothetical protein